MKCRKATHQVAGTLCFIGLLGLAGSVEATLIDRDYYTTDSRAGLDWLDLSLTTGLSVNDVTNQVGNTWYEDYRYAKSWEVLQLWDHAGLQQGDSVSSQTDPIYIAMERFIELLGYTDRHTRTEGINGLFDPSGGEPSLADYAQMTLYWSTHFPDGSANVWPIQSDAWGLDARDDRVGHYLVRRVPEPSTLMLVAVGLIGGLGISHRRSTAKK